jgi:hypothetical protein
VLEDADLFGSGPAAWNLPPNEAARQAIAPLRGYAYQLHRSLGAWIALGPGEPLFLEVAEDYARIAVEPSTLNAVLTATQVKDTRESGAVTLNSPDVLDAIYRLWALRSANPGRQVRLTFLTTSPIGRERKGVRADEGMAGLDAWRRAARGGSVEALRAALLDRLGDGELKTFVQSASDAELRRDLLVPLTWACGEPPYQDIAADNRDTLIELGHPFGATPDLSGRAADILLVHVLDTIIAGGERRLTQADFLRRFHAAVSVSVPGQLAMQMAGAASPAARLDWVGPEDLRTERSAPRKAFVDSLIAQVAADGAGWVHGATGLGKSTAARLAALQMGGTWKVLDLRDLPGEVAADRLDAARLAISRTATPINVIIDDVATEQQGRLERPLARLRQAQERRDGRLILTSHTPPDRRLREAAGLGSTPLAVPSLDADDAAALVSAYGGEPARWAHFALLAGAGHPQLIHVVIAGLAERSWPAGEMDRWMTAGFTNQDVEAERTAARLRVVEELAPTARALLYRAARITGVYDRELVLVVARSVPPVENGAQALDGLVGHWIEHQPPDRLRTSPLATGMDKQMLAPDELERLDRAIAQSILARSNCPADLLNIALLHALMAKAGSELKKIALAIFSADGDSRTHAADNVWLLRDLANTTKPLFAGDTHIDAMLRLAQFRLIVVRGKPKAVNRSAQRVVGAIDKIGAPRTRQAFAAMALTMMLMDPYGVGKLDNWLDLVDRLEAVVQADPRFGKIVADAARSIGQEPLGFMFVSHAINLQSLTDVSVLFARLEAMAPAARARKLGYLTDQEAWGGHMLDQAWLKESERDGFAPKDAAETFTRLAKLALDWGARDLAARCYRCRAIMLDEYLHDPALALASLDDADAQIPDHLTLLRERAKVLWRQKDFETALGLFVDLEPRLRQADPLETAFAFREAAVSAGELGRWSEAASFFADAKSSLEGLESATPMAVGLGFDAAVAQFAAGDRDGGLRNLRLAAETLDRIDPAASLRAYHCHVAARHVVLWVQGQVTGATMVDGKRIELPPGIVSNPAPAKAVKTQPISPRCLIWFMLSRTALHHGLSEGEVLAWPGVQDARRYVFLEVMIRTAIISAAILHRHIDEFTRHLRAFAEGATWAADQARAGPLPDVMAPALGEIPISSPDALALGELRKTVRATSLAMAVSLTLGGGEDAGALLARLEHSLQAQLGFAPLPELQEQAPRSSDDLESIVTAIAGDLARSSPLAPSDQLVTHLRLWSWVRESQFSRMLGHALAERVRSDWETTLAVRTSYLIDPMTTVPPIRAALRSSATGLQKVATILAVAHWAVQINLSDEFRQALAIGANQPDREDS